MCDPVQVLNSPLSHLLYADDLVILSTSEQGLNKCLENLGTYCTTWQLEVNLKKSEVIIFNTTGRLLNGYTFNYQGKCLNIVKDYCYLGIDFACSGSLKIGRKNIMEKARKAMSPLLSIIPDFQISCKKSLKLFHSFIRPVALYNAENLSQLTRHQIKALEENKSTFSDYLIKSDINIVHQKFLKYILGVNRSCSNMATLEELGEFPLHMYGLISMLSFWHRSSLMPVDTLVKQALNLVTRDGPESSDWFATVNYLIKLLNMENSFHDPASMDNKKFTSLSLTKIKQLFINQWKNAISRVPLTTGETNKLKFYSSLKTVFELEPYLDNVNNFYLRKAITKLRCSDHKLKIETGRHYKLKLEERICDVCKIEIETECHFLTSCPLYGSLRDKYLKNIHVDGIINALSCKDKDTAFKIGNFTTKALKIRENTLNPPEEACTVP